MQGKREDLAPDPGYNTGNSLSSELSGTVQLLSVKAPSRQLKSTKKSGRSARNVYITNNHFNVHQSPNQVTYNYAVLLQANKLAVYSGNHLFNKCIHT